MVESAVRAVLVWRSTAATALLVNRLVPWVVYVGLLAWTFWWGRRVRGADDPLQREADEG